MYLKWKVGCILLISWIIQKYSVIKGTAMGMILNGWQSEKINVSYTCWMVPNVLRKPERKGRQKLTRKNFKIVWNCIYRYTKCKKRNMKIVASSIINIYKQVKKWSNKNKGISYAPQWERKTDLLFMIPPKENNWLQHCSWTHGRNSHARAVWAGTTFQD